MKLTVLREALLKPLQLATGVVERRQTLPILSHVLLEIRDKTLSFIGTDLEVELVGMIDLDVAASSVAAVTLPGRKFLDICRALPENSTLELNAKDGKAIIASGRSRFTLATLPAQEFPRTGEQKCVMEFSVSQKDLRALIEKTSFSIPPQDVRQYLNGLLFEVKNGTIQALATDGHRLAINKIKAESVGSSFAQVIIPRKGVFELLRLLENSKDKVQVGLNDNFVRVTGDNFALTSKLVSGKFPNYSKIIPKKGDKIVEVDREEFKQALTRVGILSNELFRSVRFQLRPGLLKLLANNPEQEEAVEDVTVDYQGEGLDTIFNIGYLLDIINATSAERLCISLKDGESGALIEEVGGEGNCLYVLMPIRQ